MCGIAGRYSGSSEVWGPAGQSLAEALLHRGPDAWGSRQFQHAELLHRRLSIIDLSDAGTQPMSNEDGSVWVTYNGELYNHRDLLSELRRAGHNFRSHSDTEVLVHGYEEWGLDGMLARLRGMFAFAVYDQRSEIQGSGSCLFLVRDRLGIKPLYYAERDGELCFASEVRALVRSELVSNEIDEGALIGFLCFGSVPAPRTIQRGIRCLPPGHYLAIDQNGAVEKRYWDLPDGESAKENGGLQEVFADAVERHLIADVPLGIFLSGGVDSSGLVAVASKRHERITTLTVAFEEQEYNEGLAARAFAKAFGTEHREVVVTAKEFRAEMPRVLASMDQWTADGVNTYFVSLAAKQAGLKVVLSGLGGDEVFWGYPHYHRLHQSRIANVYGGLPGGLRRLVNVGLTAYGGACGQERWRRFGYCGNGHLNEGLYMVSRGFFPPEDVARLLDADVRQVHDLVQEALAPLRRPAVKGLDLDEICRLEFQRYLHDQLLRDSDVFSMAHSIELRVPYLDHVLVEAAWGIPAAEKVQSGINKPALVKAVAHPLVEAAARKKKRGFTFPFAKWLARDAGAMRENALAAGPLNRRAVESCWDAFMQGRRHWSRAWATVVAARY